MTQQPCARDLLAAAYAEEFPPLDIWPPDPARDQQKLEQRVFVERLLATPSGQHLAAIVDAAVAYVAAEDDGLPATLDRYRALFAAIDAAGAPR